MGKKHGSLTRAGKVRKQTPKVEKKEGEGEEEENKEEVPEE